MSVRKPLSADPRQGNLGFFVEPAPAEAPRAETPADEFDRAIREAVAATLTGAPMGRDEIAEAMGKVLGRRVSKTQLDQWSAPSQDDRRLPVDALRALGQVTGDWRALHVLAEACGFKALTRDEALCAEFGALAAMRRHIDGRSRELTKDMEGLVEGLIARLGTKVAS